MKVTFEVFGINMNEEEFRERLSDILKTEVKILKLVNDKKGMKVKIDEKTDMFVELLKEVEEILRQAAQKFQLSARSYMKMIKVARTIADLDSSDEITVAHMAEALQYKPKNYQNA